MNKKILFLLLLSLIALPTAIFAQVTLGSMAAAAMNAVITAAGYIVVIMWVVTGILFLISMGDPSKLSAAKIGLIAAVAGTVIVIIAQFATDFVGGIFGI